MTGRACLQCLAVKPLAGYHRHHGSALGRRARCSDCVCAKRRSVYNPSAAQAYQRAYKATAEYRRTFELRRCQHCLTEFRFYASLERSRAGQGKFCSVACRAASGRVEVPCEKCGTRFSTWKSVRRRFCSLECAGRLATPKSLTRGPSLYATPTWRNGLRRMVIERDGGMCQRCGTTRGLVVHHIRPWRISRDNSFTNLITVCRACHASAHANATCDEFVPILVESVA